MIYKTDILLHALLLLHLTACGPNQTTEPTNQPAMTTPPTPQLDTITSDLLRKQTKNFPKIISELKKNGRKTDHWIWWVFPTEMPGVSESLPKTSVTLSTVDELVSNADLAAWSEILEKIFELLKASPMGPLTNSNNVPNPAIIPSIDHGRIHFAMIFWLQKAKNTTQKYPRFFAAMTNLNRFKWK